MNGRETRLITGWISFLVSVIVGTRWMVEDSRASQLLGTFVRTIALWPILYIVLTILVTMVIRGVLSVKRGQTWREVPAKFSGTNHQGHSRKTLSGKSTRSQR
jgi:hypothetical protein